MSRATVLGQWPFRYPGKRHCAFTLIELLTVIAIIAILASLLLAALARTKGRGQRVLCLSNSRQLIVAWMLYTDEHNDRLPYNFGAAQTRKTVANRTYMNWVNNVMTWELEPENTNTALLARGGLGPYCGAAPSLYRCPSDRALSQVQQQAGWEQRTRSISMNAMVGDAGDFTLSGTNVNNPYYRQFFSSAQIPQPSHIFVFIEEHPDSINDGYFLNKPKYPVWQDLPASYHDGGANLTYADGHAETHLWRFASTKPPSKADAAGLPFDVPLSERSDFDWLMERTSLKVYKPASSASPAANH